MEEKAITLQQFKTKNTRNEHDRKNAYRMALTFTVCKLLNNAIFIIYEYIYISTILDCKRTTTITIPSVSF